MDTLRIFSIIFAVLAFIDALYVGFFSGEKYKMWYFRHIGDGKQYDLKKFKIVHACFLVGGAVCFLIYGLVEKGYVALLFLVVLMAIQQIVFNSVCRKSKGK